MPLLSVEKQYQTDKTPTQQQMDAIFESVETFVNITKIDQDNIQAGSITSDIVDDEAVTVEKIQTNAVTLAKLASEVTAFLVPAGAIRAYTGSSAPSGWLLCDGSAVSRVTYAALFTVISETHGEGNNTTTFNVPDYRGRFLRGKDAGSARDPNASSRTAMNTGGNTGDAVGTLQAEAVALPVVNMSADSQGAHTHTVTGYSSTGGTGAPVFDDLASGSGGTYVVTTASGGAHTHTITGGGDSETRPTNAYVNFIIKT